MLHRSPHRAFAHRFLSLVSVLCFCAGTTALSPQPSSSIHPFDPPLPPILFSLLSWLFSTFLLCTSTTRVWESHGALRTAHFVLGVFCLLCAEPPSCLPNTPHSVRVQCLFIYLQATRSAGHYGQLWRSNNCCNGQRLPSTLPRHFTLEHTCPASLFLFRTFSFSRPSAPAPLTKCKWQTQPSIRYTPHSSSLRVA